MFSKEFHYHGKSDRTTSNVFSKCSAVAEDVKLVNDLRQSLGKRIVDVDILENAMRELDKTKDDQITFGQVESVLHKAGIQLDQITLTRWMEASRTTRTTWVTSCSISKLIQILQKSTNPEKNLYLERGTFIYLLTFT